MKASLVVAVLCLAAGIGILFAFCHGTTGLSLAYPLSGASVHIDITTTGIPAIVGLVLSVLGTFLLFVATIIALAGMLRSKRDGGLRKRRDTAFEE
ncbi:MAG TPA: hypothetical protein VKB47_01035 [Terracidiphilus sp.]|nr:hypothetical protein [Terracidiphilus sp.]